MMATIPAKAGMVAAFGVGGVGQWGCHEERVRIQRFPPVLDPGIVLWAGLPKVTTHASGMLPMGLHTPSG